MTIKETAQIYLNSIGKSEWTIISISGDVTNIDIVASKKRKNNVFVTDMMSIIEAVVNAKVDSLIKKVDELTKRTNELING